MGYGVAARITIETIDGPPIIVDYTDLGVVEGAYPDGVSRMVHRTEFRHGERVGISDVGCVIAQHSGDALRYRDAEDKCFLRKFLTPRFETMKMSQVEVGHDK